MLCSRLNYVFSNNSCYLNHDEWFCHKLSRIVKNASWPSPGRRNRRELTRGCFETLWTCSYSFKHKLMGGAFYELWVFHIVCYRFLKIASSFNISFIMHFLICFYHIKKLIPFLWGSSEGIREAPLIVRNNRGTLRLISLRCLDRFLNFWAQNDGLSLSFRLRGHSTSGFHKKMPSEKRDKFFDTSLREVSELQNWTHLSRRT